MTSHHRSLPARRRFLVQAAGIAGAAAGLCVTPVALAQDWPSRPITIVIPYPPGGPNDIAARMLAEHLRKSLGQTVVVENKPGAGGAVGSTHVMRAQPDGYTLLFANSGALVVQAALKSPPPYDPATAFTPIVKIVDAPNYIGVNADVPASSIGELIALAKRNPGKLNYTSPGIGSFGNFVGEYLKLLSAVDIVHVPGKGSAWGASELMAGRIEIMVDPVVLNHRAGGRVKVLATTQGNRSEAYPDIPTVKESGGPDLSLVGWFGLLGPANLPRQVVERLDAATRRMLADPDARKTLFGLGLTPAPESMPQFSRIIHDDKKMYADIKTKAGIQIE